MKIATWLICDPEIDDAVCTIMGLDDSIYFMLDCGIGQELDPSNYQKHRSLIEKVDIVLLSRGDLKYSGALPFLLQSILRKETVVYATSPITRAAWMSLGNRIINGTCWDPSQLSIGQSILPGCKEIFDQIIELRFLQRCTVNRIATDYSINITPFAAGQQIGASAWLIECNIVNILYLVDFFHYNELHLNGLDLSQIRKQRVDVLISNFSHKEDSSNQQFLNTQANRSIWSEQIVQWLADLKNNSQGFIAVWPPTRLFEIWLLIYDIFLQYPGLFPNPLRFYDNHKYFIDLFSGQIDFMGHDFNDRLQTDRYDPFNDKFMMIQTQVVQSGTSQAPLLIQLETLLEGPMMPALLSRLIDTNARLLVLGEIDPSMFVNQSLESIIHTRNRKNESLRRNLAILQKNICNRDQEKRRMETESSLINDDIYEQNDDNTLTDERELNSSLLDMQTDEFLSERYSVIADAQNMQESCEILYDYKDFVRFHYSEVKRYTSSYGERFPTEDLRTDQRLINTTSRASIDKISVRKDSCSACEEFIDVRQACSSWPEKQVFDTQVQITAIPIWAFSESSALQHITSIIRPRIIVFTNGNENQINILRSLASQNEREREIYSLKANAFCSFSLQSSILNIYTLNCQVQMENIRALPVSGELDVLVSHTSAHPVDYRMSLTAHASSYDKTNIYYSDQSIDELYRYFLKEGIPCQIGKEGLILPDGLSIKRQGKQIKIIGRYNKNFVRIRKLLSRFLNTK